MKNQVELLKLLEEVLGPGKHYKKQNEVAFHCPICNHPKKKLQINLTTGRYHCWVCQTQNHMAGNSLWSLFKRVRVTHEQLSRLSNLIGPSRLREDETRPKTTTLRSLPHEFKSLMEPRQSPYYLKSMHYLTSRGITTDDILKYNIGYAESGRYRGRVIIPSYAADGQLNWFTARDYDRESTLAYMTPSWDKDFVGFELFINWKLPIVLVEGAFDAIAVKINAIPLFGKTISETLYMRIMQNNVSDIYIALDRDAIKDAMRHIETFLGDGRTVYFVELNQKDPSLIGFEGMQKILRSTKKTSMADVFRMRLA